MQAIQLSLTPSVFLVSSKHLSIPQNQYSLRSFPKLHFRPLNTIKPPPSSLNCVSRSDNRAKFNVFPFSSSFLNPIKPHLINEWQPILIGWVCSAISVYCLSKVVPMVGKISTTFANFESDRWIKEGLILSVLLFIRSVVNYWQQAFLWEAALNSACRIRTHVFDRVLKRDLGFFEGSGVVSTGDIAYRITAEAADVADTVYALLNVFKNRLLETVYAQWEELQRLDGEDSLVCMIFGPSLIHGKPHRRIWFLERWLPHVQYEYWTIVPNTLQLFAMATQMFVISPALSLISAMVIPCMSLVIAYLGERLRKLSRKAHISIARLSAYLNEVLPSILVVKANNAELCESSRFQRLAQDDLTAHLRKKKMKALIPQIIQVIYMGALLIFCGGSMMVSRGFFDRSCMVSFITSLILLIEPIQGAGKAYNELKQGEPAIERLFELTRFSSQVIEKPDALDLHSVIGDVKFCGITFKYGDDMPLVLNGLNLHIKPGETVALVGPSGGGKSTLTKLLLRLYNPLEGCILVDDNDIQDIRSESLRRHVALVSQDTTLFSGTVAENIGYRDLMRGINMMQVEDAAKLANADEFIRTLSQGYETNIGQRGSLLSGGQKQRLAIARALYQNSSILILDEATSALDNRSEQLVRQALERLMVNHTVLVIAHRMETVMMADRIVLLDGGKLQDVTHSFHSEGHCGSVLSSGLII